MIKVLGLAWRLFASCLMALLALAASLWFWSGGNGSLATALDYALPRLPVGHTVVVSAVSGSLLDGGHIGRLRWQGLGLVVDATDVTIAWDWRGLLQRELRLSRLAAGRVVVEDHRPPSPAHPLGDLALPLRVDARVTVTELLWQGSAPLQLQNLAGHYIFDSEQHRLDKGEVRISSGTYQVQGSLQASGPQALTLSATGTVQTRVPGIPQPMNLQAQASLDGALAGPNAEVHLQARLQPGAGNEGMRSPVQAAVQARLRPWQAQPVVNAQANWQGLDLAALWPQAPRTLSSGQAAVVPSGPGWRADVKLDNRHSASLDRQGLPLDQLQAALLYRDGSWLIESVLASGAGGRIEGRGSYVATTGQREGLLWQGTATLRNINPRALHSQLPEADLDGQITANQSGAGLSFRANLQARAGRAAPQDPVAQISRRIRVIGFDGRWLAPNLQLDRLNLQTDDARLSGQLALDTQRRAAEGQLSVSMPGGSAQLTGMLARDAGAGELKLTVTEAALAARWLAQWPGMGGLSDHLPSGGELKLDGQWEGGWESIERDLNLTLALRSPRLDLPGSDASTPGWQLRDVQADISGRINALSLSAQALLLRGEQSLQVQTRGSAAQLAGGDWQMQLAQARLLVQDPVLPGRWALELSQAVTLDWRQRDRSHTLSVSTGSLALTGPAAGTALVSWQPAQWSRRDDAAEPAKWRSQGRIDGLPLAWLELLGQTRIANLGLRGNLLFGGEWDARGSAPLQVNASLTRTSGDLRLLAEEVQLGTLSNLGSLGELNAGVREARVRLSIDGAQMKALLDWDSERAGQAQAELSSVLQAGPDGWRWPAEAPLSGNLKVQLPPVGAWSLLAPPGWRLRGTLDADAMLYGTRAAPLWRGRLQARDLAVRSVADGIDFSQGQLRVRLDGESLEIEDFTLQGAPLAGSSGGTISVAGNLRWPRAEGRATGSLLSRLRMDFVAQARSLRVSARADRRLVISGQLKASLEGDQLALRGALTADQALFILPEDNAPQLGDDVKVRRPGAPAASVTPAKGPAVLTVRPDVLLTLDLGQDFQVRGRGLNTRVAGSVTLRNAGERSLAPLLRGELRTVQGSYKAYGQQLDIEAGVLRFNGPYDNPSLDILAIRPNLSQRVGVQITGTAIAPVVRLYAEPELPEAEKLAWLVLGRSAGTGGAEAAVLQQAALALLGGSGRGLPGNLGQALGLDEVTMRGSTSNADGTTTGASVTLGKRLSRDFYVAYERSLGGALGTLYILFDLSRRLTLRAQTGEQSAVDLIFTLRYD